MVRMFQSSSCVRALHQWRIVKDDTVLRKEIMAASVDEFGIISERIYTRSYLMHWYSRCSLRFEDKHQKDTEIDALELKRTLQSLKVEIASLRQERDAYLAIQHLEHDRITGQPDRQSDEGGS